MKLNLTRVLILTAFIVLQTATAANAGYLYVYNQVNGGANQIYGYLVNESSGALTLLSGFPVASGGNGGSGSPVQDLTIDATNRRLYALNGGSGTMSVFTINADGSLTATPFSPVTLTSGLSTVRVHPSGSPVIIGRPTTGSPNIYSFNITATTATAAAGSPYTTTADPFSASFSRDGNNYYVGGNSGANFAGYSVNPATGVLTALAGSPFSAGVVNPSNAFVTDNAGRLFASSHTETRAFTTTSGVPAAVTGNPFASGLSNSAGGTLDGVLHPNQNFYYVSDRVGSRVGAYQISGSGAATTLSAVAGSPFTAGGTETGSIVLSSNGNFLFAANAVTRNVTTFNVNSGTGVLTANNTQAANSQGTAGRLVGIAYITGFVVNNNGDGADINAGNGVCETGVGNNICTLRAAVEESNALAGDDVISFAAGVTSISVATPITISSNINITGTSPGSLSVSGGGVTRIFNVLAGNTVSISAMTLANGRAASSGGAINNAGTLSLTNCVLNNNTSDLESGALDNTGTATITNSTFSNNTTTASDGGGIATYGALTITNTTFFNNRALNGGGGAISLSSGGALNGSVNVTNSTFSANVASVTGGAIYFTSPMSNTVTNCTFTLNRQTNVGSSGGAFGVAAGSVTLRSTIVANNTRADGGQSDITTTGGTVSATSSFNLIGTGGAGGLTNGVNNNQVGVANAGLDALGNYGGPTQTHALSIISPAIDKGDNFGSTADQRGLPRPVDNLSISNAGNGSDIGAYESQATTPASVSIAGRVLTPEGRGLNKAVVVLTDASGRTRTVKTTTFGYYRFEDVIVGETCIFSVQSKSHQFSPQVIFVTEDMEDLNFTALARSVVRSLIEPDLMSPKRR